MTKQRAVQYLMLIGCLTLSGCASDQSSPPQVTSSVAASADQAGWEMYTKKAEDAMVKGDKAGAEASYKIAIAEAEKLGQDTPGVAASTANLADFYYVQGEGNKADDLYKRSLAVHEKAVGKQHTDLIKDLAGLGKVSILRKKYPDAVAYYERAEEILKASKMDTPPDIQQGLDMAKKLATGKK